MYSLNGCLIHCISYQFEAYRGKTQNMSRFRPRKGHKVCKQERKRRNRILATDRLNKKGPWSQTSQLPESKAPNRAYPLNPNPQAPIHKAYSLNSKVGKTCSFEASTEAVRGRRRLHITQDNMLQECGILGLYWGYIWILEKKMKTTVISLGLYLDDGKENGNEAKGGS